MLKPSRAGSCGQEARAAATGMYLWDFKIFTNSDLVSASLRLSKAYSSPRSTSVSLF
jgi:hypothetical protein